MASSADRTIDALQATHDELDAVVAGLSDEQLTGPSGASEWTIAEVLSHLGSGSEIGLAGLQAGLAGEPAPGQEFNQGVWDRWNAMSPQEQAAGFREHDARLVEAYEALTPEQRESARFQLGFLPAPLSTAGLAGMRLNEAVLHSWDVRVALDSAATVGEPAAEVVVGHFAGELAALFGYLGKADQLPGGAVVALGGSGLALVVDDGVRVSRESGKPTARFDGGLEAALRLVSGRLREPYAPAGLTVDGNVGLDDLRRVFPGY